MFVSFLGCCFVICPSRQEADKAVNACHNKKTLPGVSSFIQILCFPVGLCATLSVSDVGVYVFVASFSDL